MNIDIPAITQVINEFLHRATDRVQLSLLLRAGRIFCRQYWLDGDPDQRGSADVHARFLPLACGVLLHELPFRLGHADADDLRAPPAAVRPGATTRRCSLASPLGHPTPHATSSSSSVGGSVSTGCQTPSRSGTAKTRISGPQTTCREQRFGCASCRRSPPPRALRSQARPAGRAAPGKIDGPARRARGARAVPRSSQNASLSSRMRRSTLASRTNTILLKRLWRKRFPTPYGGGSRERPSFGRCRRQRLVLRSTAHRPSAAWSMSPDTRKLGAADALVATGRPADPQVQHPAPSSGSAQRSNAAWSRHSTNVLAVRQPCGGLKRCPTLYGAFPSCPYAVVTWSRWHVTLRNRQKWPKPVFPEMHVRCELRGCRVRPSVRHAASGLPIAS